MISGRDINDAADVCERALTDSASPIFWLRGPTPYHWAEQAVPATTASDFAAKVCSELDAIGTMLIAKNAAYGNSALAPVRVFSRASTEEQLLVRIDDKLSRLARGAAAGEDVVRDLVGYLVLLLIARSAA